MKMDAAYFIAKFEAIPEEKWCTMEFTDEAGNHCAAGHCGCDSERGDTAEGEALNRVLGGYTTHINDGHYSRYQQHTPKQRILAALRDAQKAGR